MIFINHKNIANYIYSTQGTLTKNRKKKKKKKHFIGATHRKRMYKCGIQLGKKLIYNILDAIF